MSTQKPAHAGSPDDTIVEGPGSFEPEKAPRAKNSRTTRWVGFVIAALVLLGIGLYATGYFVAGDKLPRNAVISGVAVGGLDRQAAVAKLAAQLEDEAAAPITVSINGVKDQVSPGAAGLSIDLQQSVDLAGAGRSLDPRHIWRVLTGGRPSDAVVAVDAPKLKAAVAALAKQHDQRGRNATIAFSGSRIVRGRSVDAVVLDQQAAAEQIKDDYLQPPGVIKLEAAVTEPDITTAEADKVVNSFARPAVAAPITVKAGSAGQFQVTPAMIGSAITFEPRNGTLEPRLDARKLRKNAEPAVSKVEIDKPRDATVRIIHGRPKVLPAVNGTEVSEQSLLKAVWPVLTRSGAARTATVELTGAKAKFTTESARKLGVKEVIGEFTTTYPHADYRNINIGRAAELINNTLLKPGETFSLNQVLGERTRANGFVDGYVISGGVLKKETGGGVSQSATTTYNAMFKAGLKDVEHQPHSLYFPRYPAGREATIYWGSIDLKFQNDTGHGVLVQAFIKRSSPGSLGSITVRMWSTQVWDEIRTPEATRSNFTSGTTRYSQAPDCEYQEPIQGFDADYYRAFIKDGKEVKREKFHWRYSPGDRIICGKDPNG